MTPHERAEEFYQLIFGSGATNTGKLPLRTIFVNEFKAQIEEACAGAYRRGKLDGVEGITNHIQSVTNARIEGWNAAREKARRIVETDISLCKSPEFVFHSNACKEIADRIGQMEMEK